MKKLALKESGKKAMLTKLYMFDSRIYPFPLLVCKCKEGTARELAERFDSVDCDLNAAETSEDYFKPSPKTAARAMTVKSKDGRVYFLVMLCSSSLDVGTAAHESLHIANMAGHYLGFPQNSIYIDEPYAYLAEWLANCIWSVYKDRPEKYKGVLMDYDL